MRTGKVKLFSTHFFCVLKTHNLTVHVKYLIINILSIISLKICFTFALAIRNEKQVYIAVLTRVAPEGEAGSRNQKIKNYGHEKDH